MSEEKYTDLQLKLALAKEMEIYVRAHPPGSPVYPFHSGQAFPSKDWFFNWRDTGRPVTPAEWDYLVREFRLKQQQPVPFCFKSWQAEFVWVMNRIGKTIPEVPETPVALRSVVPEPEMHKALQSTYQANKPEVVAVVEVMFQGQWREVYEVGNWKAECEWEMSFSEPIKQIRVVYKKP